MAESHTYLNYVHSNNALVTNYYPFKLFCKEIRATYIDTSMHYLMCTLNPPDEINGQLSFDVNLNDGRLCQHF